MSQIKPILIFLVSTICGNASAYPTAIGSVWKYVSEFTQRNDWISATPDCTDSIVSDTSINGKTYHKVIRSGENAGSYFFRTRGQQVLIWRGPEEYLLYDFSDSIKIGDEISIIPIRFVLDSNNSDMIMKPVRLENIEGDLYTYSYSGHEFTFDKKFGQIDDGFYCLIIGLCPVFNFILKSFAIKNDVLFENQENYTSISAWNSASNQPMLKTRLHKNNIVVQVLGTNGQHARYYNLLGKKLKLLAE